MPKGAFYRALNDVLFHGKRGRDLLDTFTFKAVHFEFPEKALIDGIHPSPNLTDMLWKCLVRAFKNPVQIQANPVPALAQLSVKDRLGYAHSDASYPHQMAPKWKGKGKSKGKRSTPYAASNPAYPSSQTRSKYQSAASYNYYPTPENCGYWGPPAYPGYQNTYAAPPASSSSTHYATAPSAPYYSSTPQVNPTSTYPPPPSPAPPPPRSNVELLEETGDSYGNISWRPLPAEPLALGTINYSCPHDWTMESHLAEVKRVQGRCWTNSMAQQSIFKEKVATMLRERALVELKKGLNASMNMASSTLAHRSIHQLNQPPPEYQHINEDLRNVMPPPPLSSQYTYYAPPN
ncbi:unnamed protein product [Rotaria magnacalcarata]|nr:unnamed protein product [Rotaria magnacalcarata]